MMMCSLRDKLTTLTAMGIILLMSEFGMVNITLPIIFSLFQTGRTILFSWRKVGEHLSGGWNLHLASYKVLTEVVWCNDYRRGF